MTRVGCITLAALVLAGLAAAGAWAALRRLDTTALTEPGPVETFLAVRAKRYLVRRESRRPLPPAPPADATSAAVGRMQFVGRCAACHGQDGRTPTELGRWMYPRAPDLGSAGVQSWSDAELFSIIRNGVRLSGMPGFGKVMADRETWSLVYYVRSLGSNPAREPVGGAMQGSQK